MGIQIPDRVVFLNIKDGNAFFDCTPQEARMAIKAVKDIRETGEVSLDIYRELASSIAEVRKHTERKPDHVSDIKVGALTANNIADSFSIVEGYEVPVSHIFMHARQYADLRKWDRDAMDIETNMGKLKLGIFALMWGAQIILSRDTPEGQVMFVGAGDPENIRVAQLNVTYNGNGNPPPMPKPVSKSDILDEKLDKIMAHLNIE